MGSWVRAPGESLKQREGQKPSRLFFVYTLEHRQQKQRHSLFCKREYPKGEGVRKNNHPTPPIKSQPLRGSFSHTKASKNSLISHPNYRKSFYKHRKLAKIPTKKSWHSAKEKPAYSNFGKKNFTIFAKYIYIYFEGTHCATARKTHNRGKRTITTATDAGDTKWEEKRTI